MLVYIILSFFLRYDTCIEWLLHIFCYILWIYSKRKQTANWEEVSLKNDLNTN